VVFGVFLSLAGLEHGVGEISQGNAPTNGVFIKSWGDSALFSVLGGEPAMTILPTFLLSGVSSVVVSAVILLWVLFYMKKNSSGLILVLLSLLLLVVGGGFGPPLMGIIVGLAGTRLNSEFPLLKKIRSRRLLTAISVIWFISVPVGMLCYLFLLPGSIILWRVSGFNDPGIIVTVSLAAFVMIVVSIASAYSYDSRLE